MNVTLASAVWGQTLNPGWCGFICREHEFVGDGIAFEERWTTGLPFVHTFVIESQETQTGLSPRVNIIEATAAHGVARGTLAQYLGQKDIQTYVRPPQGWTEDIGNKITAEAAKYLGQKYGFSVIAADAIANSYLGHFIDSWTKGSLDKTVCKVLTDQHRKICSQLVAQALKSQLYLSFKGCLRLDPAQVTPKQLGNDDRVFAPICYRIA